MQISRRLPGEGASNDSILRAISSETLDMSPELLHSDKQSVISFSVIKKCMTLHGYFALNCRDSLADSTVRHSKIA